LEDITNPYTACLNKDTNNLSDFFRSFSIITFKISYLFFCVKDDNGDICPLREYLQDHESEFNDLDENTSEVNPEQLQIIANDCKDSKCNDRMITMYNFITNLEETFSSDDDSGIDMNPASDFSELFDPNVSSKLLQGEKMHCYCKWFW